MFDALTPPQTFKPFGLAALEFTANKRNKVVFVGSGARMYDVVGRVFPGGLVGLMMGWNRRRTVPPPQPQDDAYKSVHDQRPGSADGIEQETPAGSGLGPSGLAPASTWGFHSLGSDSGIWEKV